MKIEKCHNYIRFITLCVVWIIFLVSFVSTHAQSPTTSVVGSVLDTQTGRPIENASVSVSGVETTRAVTDSSGNFAATNIPVADPFLQVTISITAPGYGTWTMRDTPLYPNLQTRLAVRLSQHDQLVIAGLPRAITGDLQSPSELPPNAPLVPSYSSNTLPPPTIRVAITPYANCGDWLNNGKPVIRVDVVDFRAYAKNVLPNEWVPSWGNTAPDSLRAGAMAVKMFAWWRVNIPGGGRSQQGADVVDNTCDQRYIAGRNFATTDTAVDATWYYRMRRQNIVDEIHYLSTLSQCQSSSLRPCMPQGNPGSYGDALSGMSWQAILHKYYDYDEQNNYIPVTVDGFGFWFFIPMVSR